MKPSEKSPQIDDAIKNIFGTDRRSSIESNHCLKPPIGCGQPIGNPEHHFKDELSLREYKISGLCQKCQDEIFESSLTDFED